jgi:hypothetical protein
MKKLILPLAAAVALAAAGAVSAQAPPPAVEIALQGRTAQVTGADALRTGPTTLRVSARSPGAFFVLVELNPGVTRQAFAAGLRRIQGPAQVRRFGVAVASGGAPYATTITLRPREYAIVEFGRQPRVVGSFTASEPGSGATAPAPDATVGLADFRFTGAGVLPRSGVVRWENRGRQMHEAVMFPVRTRADQRSVARAFRRGAQEPRGIAGPPAPLGVGLVDRGTVNDVQAERVRPGRYVVVCFLPDERRRSGRPRSHAQLGMVREVTVR